MAKVYEDDLRNAERNDIAGTLAARQSPFGYGLEQAGRAMSKSPFSAASMMPDGSVPLIGGAGSSLLPMPQAQPPMGGNVLQQMQRMRPMRRL